MPIADTDRINKESTVSRYMQLKIPGLEPGFNFVEHDDISAANTNDKIIVDNINNATEPLKIVVDSLSLTTDSTAALRNNLYSIEEQPIGTTIVEPEPTSSLGEYNKMSVVIDRDGHTLFFDYTTNNNRTFLHHPAGSYLNIENDGSWLFKSVNNWTQFTKGNDFKIIDGEESKVIGGVKKTNVKGNSYLTIERNYNLSIGDNFLTTVGGNQSTEINGTRTTIITKNDLSNIKGYKEQTIQGLYVVNSNHTIALNAPTIQLNTKNLITSSDGSLKEKIGGERRIEANQIGFSSGNDINMNAGQHLTKSVVGFAEETVQGFSLIPPLDLNSKKTIVQLYNYLVDVWIGDIKMLTGFGLGPSLILSNTLGSLSLKTLFGGIEIDIAGNNIISGNRVDVGGSLTAISTEPAMLGLTHTNWAAAHFHPTGTGPSGVPTTAGALTASMSTKVFIAAA